MHPPLLNLRTALLLATVSLLLCLFVLDQGISQNESFRDAAGRYYGEDFINVWAAPRIAGHDRATLYDVDGYNRQLVQLNGAGLSLHNWSYPPVMLLFAKPFSLPPLRIAYALWTVVGLLGFGLAVWWGTPAGNRRATLVLSLCAPATLINLIYGQNGCFTAALTLGALTLLERRPAASGALLGALLAKPQLALSWPFVLLRQRRWRTVIAGLAAGAALVAVSLAFYGADAWRLFFTQTLGAQSQFMHRPGSLSYFELISLSLPLALQELGLSATLAFRLYAATAFAGALGLILTASRPLPGPVLALLVTSGALVLTPYSFNYDMTALSVALLWCLGEGPRRAWHAVLYLAVYLLPVLMILLWVFCGVPVAAFLITGLFFVTVGQRLCE